MGEIAEMHIEAYQAGLDPNEMDGADWVDFYDARSSNVGECPVCQKICMGERGLAAHRKAKRH